MNKISALVLFLGLFASCNSKGDKKQPAIKQDAVPKKVITHRIPEELFLHHFHILDSASNATSGDVIECCHNSTWFMEEHTKIESEGDKGYEGNISFTKKDLRKWHEWYDKEYRTKNE